MTEDHEAIENDDPWSRYAEVIALWLNVEYGVPIDTFLEYLVENMPEQDDDDEATDD